LYFLGTYDKYDGIILPNFLSSGSLWRPVQAFLRKVGFLEEHKELPKRAELQKRSLDLYLQVYKELLFEEKQDAVSCGQIVQGILDIFKQLQNPRFSHNHHHFRVWNWPVEKFSEVCDLIPSE